MSILDLGDRLASAITGIDLPYGLAITRTTLVDPDTPWDPSDDVETAVDYDCSGWRDTFDAALIANSVVQATDLRVFVLANSLSITPAITDKLKLDGSTYTILAVSSDPAGACWELRCSA